MAVELGKLVDEYMTHEKHRKMLEKMTGELKRLIKKQVEEHGVPDDKGHRWLQAGKWQLQVQKRQGEPKLDPQAVEDWAKERGFWNQVSRTVEVLDEDALMAYMYERRDDKELEAEFQDKYVTPEPTYAFQQPQEDKYNDY